MKGRWLTKAERKAIRASREEGKTWKQVAQEHSVTVTTAMRHGDPKHAFYQYQQQCKRNANRNKP